MVEYHTYTIADVKAWLYSNKDNGLSEAVISKIRANAIVHNPYVEDNMVVVVSANDGDKVVGFTAMFPEHLVRPDVWLTVPTTLYAHPDYAGEFIGYYVSKALHDTADGRLVIGTDLAKETILIDKLLGLKADTFSRKRIILRRTIHWDTFRHILSSFFEPIRLVRQHTKIRRILKSIPADLELEYSNFIDAEMYNFIVNHSVDSMFVRSQEMLNWILSFPFGVEAPLISYIRPQNAFASQTTQRKRVLFKVYISKKLVGICMIDSTCGNSNVRMLYTETQYADSVYKILLQHVMRMKTKTLHSLYVDFNEFIKNAGVSLKMYDEPLVFTHPESLVLNHNKQLQGMDGDMFA